MDASNFANIDLAQISLYMFWIFFALLIYYLQTENMREGYPLENEEGGAEPSNLPLPQPKTFKLPHGRGEVTFPDYKKEAREVALRNVQGPGYPLEPTGDPMLDGVGPASWAPRRDIPELDGKGHVKIVPMSTLDFFKVSAGRDPRGMPVVSGDDQTVGTITDMWIDEGESMVRYLEYTLDPAWGEGKRIVPIQLVRILRDKVAIHSLYADQFANVPRVKGDKQITMLEEDKICGYYAGGKLYAGKRQEPVVG